MLGTNLQHDQYEFAFDTVFLLEPPPMLRQEIREILASVSKPFRYTGGEVGSHTNPWDECDVRLCLAFPDVYEIGMSHVGLSILYHIINDQPGMLAERVFTPWADMERELVTRQMPLFSLESHRPLADFDIVGFSLCHELTYTNVLAMLGLAGIPLRATERFETRDPLVIAGGPCAFNPMPMAPFFDAIVIGDGERAIVEISSAVRDAKLASTPRAKLLGKLSQIKGAYVPLIRDPGPVQKATIPDLDTAPFPTAPVIPHAATQHRVVVEVSRGCARGCRFCQAGYTYRPVRQRTGERATDLACNGITITGCENLSFLSLSIGDWAPIEASLESVHQRIKGMPVGITLPSLRVESLSASIINSLGSSRSGGFTLAPEAGSERLRRLINKGNTDADLYASAQKIFSNGWRAIKLYFMIGLPHETPTDIDRIVEIANQCLAIGRRFHRRPEVTISTSTFVPKAHTPFQWERQISIEEIQATQRVLKRKLKAPGLSYRWHDAGMSYLEGVFARGGPELADVIENAYRNGARFDGWDEFFDLARWREAFAGTGMDSNTYLEARTLEHVLPWEHLGVGPSREFLIRERERAQALIATPDCTRGECQTCGMCDFCEVKNRIALRDPGPETRGPSFGFRVPGPGSRIPAFRYRLHYRKVDRAAFLGSVQALDALRRGLRAAGLPLVYSEGYTPRPRISAGPALSPGVESEAEFIDVELQSSFDPPEIVRRAAGRLPGGMEVTGAWRLEPPLRSIEASIAATIYEIYVEGQGMVEITVPNEKPVRRLQEILLEHIGVQRDALHTTRIRKVKVEWKTKDVRT